MAQLISEIWEGLRSAGLPEVMLYLADQSASRCHWKDTTMIGDVRVALLADQDRQIVRILPVDSCVGIGIASPKGTDPSGYKTVVHQKLRARFGGEAGADEAPAAEVDEDAASGHHHASVAPATAVEPPPAPVPEPEPPLADASRPDPLTSRWGMAPRTTPRTGFGTSNTGSFPPVRRI